jgi:hypothetical protein
MPFPRWLPRKCLYEALARLRKAVGRQSFGPFTPSARFAPIVTHDNYLLNAFFASCQRPHLFSLLLSVLLHPVCATLVRSWAKCRCATGNFSLLAGWTIASPRLLIVCVYPAPALPGGQWLPESSLVASHDHSSQQQPISQSQRHRLTTDARAMRITTVRQFLSVLSTLCAVEPVALFRSGLQIVRTLTFNPSWITEPRMNTRSQPCQNLGSSKNLDVNRDRHNTKRLDWSRDH